MFSVTSDLHYQNTCILYYYMDSIEMYMIKIMLIFDLVIDLSGVCLSMSRVFNHLIDDPTIAMHLILLI